MSSFKKMELLAFAFIKKNSLKREIKQKLKVFSKK